MKVSGAPSKTGRRRRPLDRAAVVDAALALAEHKGSGVLTMRRLGTALRVDPTALYRIFRDKDELLLAVYERVLSLAAEVVDDSERDLARTDWRSALRYNADCAWRALLRYPVITAEAFARTTGGPAERANAEALLATLEQTGLPPREVVLYYRSFTDTVLSLCGGAASLAILEPEVRTKDATAWTRIYAQLPGETYPVARAHADYLATVGDREIFDVAVEALIAGIEKRIKSLSAAAQLSG